VVRIHKNGGFRVRSIITLKTVGGRALPEPANGAYRPLVGFKGGKRREGKGMEGKGRERDCFPMLLKR